MNTMILLQICLVIHLAGLTLMAGTIVSEYVVFRTLAKRFEQESLVSGGLIELSGRFPAVLGIGAASLILSGIGLFTITHGAFGHQLWFQVKMLLIIAIIANGFTVGLRLEHRLKEGIKNNEPVRIKNAFGGLQRFCLVQIALFLTIIVLAVFKFN